MKTVEEVLDNNFLYVHRSVVISVVMWTLD